MASIIQWNCHGYFPNYEEIITLIQQYNPAIILLQETIIGNYNPRATSGYTFYGFSPTGRAVPGDGLAFLVRNDISHKSVNVRSHFQTLTFQVKLQRLVTICNLYISNHDNISTAQLTNLTDQLQTPFLLCGDFNAKHPSWGNNNVNGRGQVVERFLLDSPFVLLNDGSPTHFHIQTGSSSAIDLSVASPDIAFALDWSTDEDLHGSDHFPIIISEVCAAAAMRTQRFIQDRADWDGFNLDTTMDDLWERHRHEDVDSLIQMFTNQLIFAAEQNIPKSHGGPPRKMVPWWNIHCSTANFERKRGLRRYKRTQSLEDKMMLKRLTARARYIKKQARRSSWQQYINSLNVDTPMSKIWSRVRKMRGIYKHHGTPILLRDGDLVSEHYDVAEALASHYESVSSGTNFTEQFQHARLRSERIPLNFDTNMDIDYNSPISYLEFSRSLKTCKNSCPGPDNITYKMIDKSHISAKRFLLEVFNKIWNEHVYPSSWRMGTILSFLKPGKNPEDVGSYRPIALTSCLGKLMEKMINDLD